jgi:hypothetical protein
LEVVVGFFNCDSLACGVEKDPVEVEHPSETRRIVVGELEGIENASAAAFAATADGAFAFDCNGFFRCSSSSSSLLSITKMEGELLALISTGDVFFFDVSDELLDAAGDGVELTDLAKATSNALVVERLANGAKYSKESSGDETSGLEKSKWTAVLGAAFGVAFWLLPSVLVLRAAVVLQPVLDPVEGGSK